MPPRKDASISASQAQQNASSDGIDAFELPKSIVTRIAKSALPSDVKLQKEAVGALVKGSTVFINYLAATAQDVASSRSHKTIGGADVLKALEIIEFGDLVPVLQGELDIYRGGRAKIKAAADAKGKGREESPPYVPAMVESDTVPHPTAADVEPGGERAIMQDDPPVNANEEEAGFDGDEDMAEAERDIEEDDDAEEPEALIDTIAVEAKASKLDQHSVEEGDVQIEAQDGAE